MAAAAHNPEFAKKMGIPQSVAKEFNEADQREMKGFRGDVERHVRKVKKGRNSRQ